MNKGEWIEALDGIGRIEGVVCFTEEDYGTVTFPDESLVHYRQLLDYENRVRIRHKSCGGDYCSPCGKATLTKVGKALLGSEKKFESLAIPENFGAVVNLSMKGEFKAELAEALAEFSKARFTCQELLDSLPHWVRGSFIKSVSSGESLITLQLFNKNFAVDAHGRRLFSRVAII